MVSKQELQVQQKRELEKKEEGTFGSCFPASRRYNETDDALSVILEMPGVDKANVNISVEDGVLT